MEHEEEHIEKGYICPCCGEDAVEGEGVDVDGNIATQRVSCTACDAVWVDTFVLKSVEKEDE